MQNKLISVIVPIYNVEPFLDECISSIVEQTYSNIEIILVDDGSEDNCPAKCDEWAKKDSRIRVLHQQNQGLSAARNIGIDMANGEYVYFVDSDDYIDCQMCEKMIRAFDENDVDVVVTNYFELNDKGKILVPQHIHPYGLLTPYEALYHLIHDNLRTHAWSKMCKKELFATVRFPVGYHCEDIGTIYKLFLQSKSIYVLKDKLYYYRQRRGSIMNKWSNLTMFDLYKMKRMRWEELVLIYPDLAEDDFKNVAVLAKSVYIRSLYSNLEKSYYNEVVEFLRCNKDKIMHQTKNKDFYFYYSYPKLYVVYRKIRHKIGLVLRKLKKVRFLIK